MHRVIIPVDFSDTALNAARFVAQMLAGRKDALAILYHNFKDSQDEEMCLTFLKRVIFRQIPGTRYSWAAIRGILLW